MASGTVLSPPPLKTVAAANPDRAESSNTSTTPVNGKQQQPGGRASNLLRRITTSRNSASASSGSSTPRSTSVLPASRIAVSSRSSTGSRLPTSIHGRPSADAAAAAAVIAAPSDGEVGKGLTALGPPVVLSSPKDGQAHEDNASGFSPSRTRENYDDVSVIENLAPSTPKKKMEEAEGKRKSHVTAEDQTREKRWSNELPQETVRLSLDRLLRPQEGKPDFKGWRIHQPLSPTRPRIRLPMSGPIERARGEQGSASSTVLLTPETSVPRIDAVFGTRASLSAPSSTLPPVTPIQFPNSVLKTPPPRRASLAADGGHARETSSPTRSIDTLFFQSGDDQLSSSAASTPPPTSPFHRRGESLSPTAFRSPPPRGGDNDNIARPPLSSTFVSPSGPLQYSDGKYEFGEFGDPMLQPSLIARRRSSKNHFGPPLSSPKARSYRETTVLGLQHTRSQSSTTITTQTVPSLPRRLPTTATLGAPRHLRTVSTPIYSHGPSPTPSPDSAASSNISALGWAYETSSSAPSTATTFKHAAMPRSLPRSMAFHDLPLPGRIPPSPSLPSTATIAVALDHHARVMLRNGGDSEGETREASVVEETEINDNRDGWIVEVKCVFDRVDETRWEIAMRRPATAQSEEDEASGFSTPPPPRADSVTSLASTTSSSSSFSSHPMPLSRAVAPSPHLLTATRTTSVRAPYDAISLNVSLSLPAPPPFSDETAGRLAFVTRSPSSSATFSPKMETTKYPPLTLPPPHAAIPSFNSYYDTTEASPPTTPRVRSPPFSAPAPAPFVLQSPPPLRSSRSQRPTLPTSISEPFPLSPGDGDIRRFRSRSPPPPIRRASPPLPTSPRTIHPKFRDAAALAYSKKRSGAVFGGIGDRVDV